jgi:hypothetical protein
MFSTLIFTKGEFQVTQSIELVTEPQQHSPESFVAEQQGMAETRHNSLSTRLNHMSILRNQMADPPIPKIGTCRDQYSADHPHNQGSAQD